MQRPTTQHGNSTPQEAQGVPSRQAVSSSSSSLPANAQSTIRLRQSQSSSSFSSSSAESHSSWGRERAAAQKGPCLFAFPLESNFSGIRYAPAVVNHIQTCGMMVANQKEGEEQRPAGQQEEEEAEGQGQSQSCVKNLSGSDQQQHHRQPCDEAEAHPVEGLIKAEEHQRHQPAAVQAKGTTGDSTCKEEEARLAPSRPSQSEGARWHVLIDAAKACATAPPDLTKHPADFVVGTTSSRLRGVYGILNSLCLTDCVCSQDTEQCLDAAGKKGEIDKLTASSVKVFPYAGESAGASHKCFAGLQK